MAPRNVSNEAPKVRKGKKDSSPRKADKTVGKAVEPNISHRADRQYRSRGR